MRSKVLCDRSTAIWDPVWEPTCCDECGHETGQYDTAEPQFHGETITKTDESGHTKYLCSRCDEEYVGYETVCQVALDRMLPRIVDEVNRSNTFLRALSQRYKS